VGNLLDLLGELLPVRRIGLPRPFGAEPLDSTQRRTSGRLVVGAFDLLRQTVRRNSILTGFFEAVRSISPSSELIERHPGLL